MAATDDHTWARATSWSPIYADETAADSKSPEGSEDPKNPDDPQDSKDPDCEEDSEDPSWEVAMILLPMTVLWKTRCGWH
jgi:hypothetical protein